MKTLDGRRVLITGGAGGLGMAFARRCGREGAEILLTDVAKKPLAEAQKALEGEEIPCLAYVMDVTDPKGVAATRKRIHREGGAVEVLVNNAGIVEGGPFLDVPLERHLTTYRINVEGVVIVTHAFLSDLIASPEGHLVNIASASGFIGLPFGSTYASSKWAVIGFSQSIRLELKKEKHRHVGVTAVCPTYVDTGMFEGVRQPLLTPLLRPEKVADKTVEAVWRNRPWVLEPFMAKLAPALSHGLPSALSDSVSELFGVTTGMKSWRGRQQGP
jgi:all-trans-retinol dehydrogenase (NAD+)